MAAVPSWLVANWALVSAFAVVGIVAASLALHAARESARGQLRRMLRALTAARARSRKAHRRTARALRRRDRLARRGERARPRLLREAEEALADARALARIADDQVAIAENHVRRVIVDEFPPARHDALRARYLPDRPPDGKPFTF